MFVQKSTFVTAVAGDNLTNEQVSPSVRRYPKHRVSGTSGEQPPGPGLGQWSKIMPRLSLTLAAAFLLLFPTIDGPASAQERQTSSVDPVRLQAMQYRSVGPSRGGRSTAVTGYRERPYEFLMGAVGGGIWRIC